MSKRRSDSTRGVHVKVKKRKGVKVRIVNVPDSDDEGPSRINTEYARLLKTRVSASGKAESVTMDRLPLPEAKVKRAAQNNPPESTVDGYEEITTGPTIPDAKAKKKRKRLNDSVSTLVTEGFSCANNSSDKDTGLAGQTYHHPRRDDHP